MSEGLVDEKMVKAIRSKYHQIIDDHNMCFGQKHWKQTIDPELVYFHLKQQGRIVDVLSPKVKDDEKVIRVDMTSRLAMRSRLPGFEEWVRDYWTEEGADAAKAIQKAMKSAHKRGAMPHPGGLPSPRDSPLLDA
uniref:Uncharacterized protein n=1 Tax=Prymnesium polylepis TaxID=72548 RepID=A0A7S4I2E7_9EUKA